MKRKHQQYPIRRGAAIVEFAVCLPVVMVLILGSIEATNSIFVKQALTSAAYEGVREAAKSSSDSNQARSRAENILRSRNVQSATVRITPADLTTATRGDLVTIEISAPLGLNSPFIGKVIADRQLTVRSVMVRE